MTTDEQIARVRELDAAATPGPWEADAGTMGVYWPGAPYRVMTVAWEPDLPLTAEYRTLAPRLADKLERAMEALWYVRQMVGVGGAARYAGAMLADIEAMES